MCADTLDRAEDRPGVAFWGRRANYRCTMAVDSHGCAILDICLAVGTGQGVEVAPTASPAVLAAPSRTAQRHIPAPRRPTRDSGIMIATNVRLGYALRTYVRSTRR